MTKRTKDKETEIEILNTLSKISRLSSLIFVGTKGFKQHWLSKRYHAANNRN